MNRLLSWEPWLVSKLTVLLSQFLEGIIHFLSLFAAGFFAAGFFAASALPASLARGFAAGLAAALAAGFLATAFFFAACGASSPSSLAAGATFSLFGRGPMVGLALSARI